MIRSLCRPGHDRAGTVNHRHIKNDRPLSVEIIGYISNEQDILTVCITAHGQDRVQE